MSLSYALLMTERNCARFEFENFTYTRNRKNENTLITKWRCTDILSKGSGDIIGVSSDFLIGNLHQHEANTGKTELIQTEKAIDSRPAENIELKTH